MFGAVAAVLLASAADDVGSLQRNLALSASSDTALVGGKLLSQDELVAAFSVEPAAQALLDTSLTQHRAALGLGAGAGVTLGVGVVGLLISPLTLSFTPVLVALVVSGAGFLVAIAALLLDVVAEGTRREAFAAWNTAWWRRASAGLTAPVVEQLRRGWIGPCAGAAFCVNDRELDEESLYRLVARVPAAAEAYLSAQRQVVGGSVAAGVGVGGLVAAGALFAMGMLLPAVVTLVASAVIAVIGALVARNGHHEERDAIATYDAALLDEARQAVGAPPAAPPPLPDAPRAPTSLPPQTFAPAPAPALVLARF